MASTEASEASEATEATEATEASTVAVADMVPGLSYRIQNGRNFDRVMEYRGPAAFKSSYFQCKYGHTWCIGIEFYGCYTITGPVPKDEITEADRQKWREEDEAYKAYVQSLEPWER